MSVLHNGPGSVVINCFCLAYFGLYFDLALIHIQDQRKLGRLVPMKETKMLNSLNKDSPIQFWSRSRSSVTGKKYFQRFEKYFFDGDGIREILKVENRNFLYKIFSKCIIFFCQQELHLWWTILYIIILPGVHCVQMYKKCMRLKMESKKYYTVF